MVQIKKKKNNRKIYINIYKLYTPIFFVLDWCTNACDKKDDENLLQKRGFFFLSFCHKMIKLQLIVVYFTSIVINNIEQNVFSSCTFSRVY